ncbi:MAG: lasso peptide biosynthesis B2 protein [Chloroflexota bacterium]
MGELRTLALADLGLTLRIVAMLVSLNATLPFVKVKRLVRWLTPAIAPPAVELAEIQRVVRHVDGVMRRAPILLFGHCLLRSLTLYYFCTRLGYPVRIAFGIRRKPCGGMDGHGWLVLEGRTFMERGTPEVDFLRVWQLPEEPSVPPPADPRSPHRSLSMGGQVDG